MPNCGRDPLAPERGRRGHLARLLAGQRGSNRSCTIHILEKVFSGFLSLLQSLRPYRLSGIDKRGYIPLISAIFSVNLSDRKA